MVMVLSLAVLLGLATTAQADTTTGRIKSVAADKQEFVLTDTAGKDWTFQADPEVKVRLNDKDAQFNQLKPGDQVDVSFRKEGVRLIATEVRAKRA